MTVRRKRRRIRSWLPAPPLAAWLEARKDDEVMMAERCGVPARRLFAIRTGEQQWVRISTADKLLTRNDAHLVDVWPDLDVLMGLEDAA